MIANDSDIASIESRLDEESTEIEEQLRDLESIGESLAGVTFRLVSESNETRLFVQLVFDQQEEISAEALRQISKDIESSDIFLGLDITLSEFDLRLADLAILVSGHLLDRESI
jgi:uncharacterized protein YPO0396